MLHSSNIHSVATARAPSKLPERINTVLLSYNITHGLLHLPHSFKSTLEPTPRSVTLKLQLFMSRSDCSLSKYPWAASSESIFHEGFDLPRRLTRVAISRGKTPWGTSQEGGSYFQVDKNVDLWFSEHLNPVKIPRLHSACIRSTEAWLYSGSFSHPTQCLSTHRSEVHTLHDLKYLRHVWAI